MRASEGRHGILAVLGEQAVDQRSCCLCGTDISDYRKGARFCSRAHSAEASRLRRLLSGQRVDGYSSVADRLAAAHKRTRRSSEVGTGPA